MTHPKRAEVQGPLRDHAPGFCAELKRQGYTSLSAANQLRLLAGVSRWLESQSLDTPDLTPARIERFLQARRNAGYTCWLSLRGLSPLLTYLRRTETIPAILIPAPDTDLDRLLDAYVAYLHRERGLAATTVSERHRIAKRFLRECATRGSGQLDLGALTVEDIQRFMLQQAQLWSVAHAKGVATALRSLLRFLHLRGDLSTSWVGAVPTVAGWRLTSLPRDIDPGHVDRLLGSCDRRRHVGRRDYAILLLLVRLGLRRGEVAALEMNDIDWRRGKFIVRGKGRRHDTLPLPLEVGQAIEAYVRRGRPRVDCRRAFLRTRAPQGPLRPSAISEVVTQACRRSGLPPIGAHQLRHTAATQMLRHGSSLAEIAQVLRHRHLATTAIYAKVDRNALATLVRPWPIGGDA